MIRNLRSGWVAMDDQSYVASIEAEVVREVPIGHVLHGQNLRLLARRSKRDDFLFELDDGRVADVHLTWTVETLPYVPSTEIYPSFEAWSLASDDEF